MQLPRICWLIALPVALVAGCAQDGPDRSAAHQSVALQALADVPAHPAPPAPPAALETETGEATFYADNLHRTRTASGEMLDQNALVAAHRRFPFGTLLRVTNLETERSVQVRVIDRGPFGAPRVAARKVIDLSRQAAREIGILEKGRAPVRVEVLSYGEGVPAN